MKSIVYLACPYSHELPSVRVARFDAVNRCASFLMNAGLHVFSPISHTHPIAEYGLPKGWDFWEPYDRVFLEQCRAVLVCCLDGWETSKGVCAELQIAESLGIPNWQIWLPANEAACVAVARNAGLIR